MTSIISRIAVRLNMETTVHGKDGSTNGERMINNQLS